MDKQDLEFLQTRSDNDIIRAVRSLIADASTGNQFTIRFCEILQEQLNEDDDNRNRVCL